MSDPRVQSLARMFKSFSNRTTHSTVELIMVFGHGCLVKLPDGRFELQGGSWADHTAAKEYASLFLHPASPIKSLPTR
ncbi:MAG: hypothetical protein EXS36_03860 [Pedosphaera sp.]|nr:hypothetical protein [Pedosphaera sp.]